MPNQEEKRAVDIHNYDDIIDLPNYFPPDRVRLPRAKRAVQFRAFMPFPGYQKLLDRVQYEYVRDNYPEMLKDNKLI